MAHCFSGYITHLFYSVSPIRRENSWHLKFRDREGTLDSCLQYTFQRKLNQAESHFQSYPYDKDHDFRHPIPSCLFATHLAYRGLACLCFAPLRRGRSCHCRRGNDASKDLDRNRNDLALSRYRGPLAVYRFPER